MALPKQLGDFSMLHNTSRFTIDSAAGLLALAGFATAPAAFATDSSQTAPCYGVNACKGQSDCKVRRPCLQGAQFLQGSGLQGSYRLRMRERAWVHDSEVTRQLTD
jgi:hypothetical protein